ncbi:unnamed protein product, partial [Parnassius apollo]
MDFQSAMETFAEAWAAANTVKSEAPSDLSQNLSSDLRRSKTPPRRSPEERAVPRPPSAPVHHDRGPHTPHTPHTPRHIRRIFHPRKRLSITYSIKGFQ